MPSNPYFGVRNMSSLFAIAPDIFCNRPVLFAYLYGSYSTGDVHPFSDLDIGVYIDDVSDIKYLELELSLSLVNSWVHDL